MQTGEIAALAAAILWTCSSMLWGQIKLPALTLNACKNVIGSVFILAHLAFVWSFCGFSAAWQFTSRPMDWCWLSLSGLVGIVIGDTFYFRCLQILGARRALLVSCASPVFATILGWIFLQQQLGLVVLSGIVITVLGVATVVSDRRADVESPGLLPGTFQAGIACGILGSVCQALGGLFSTLGMQEGLGPLEATFIRLLVAGVVTVSMLVARQHSRRLFRESFQRSQLKFIVPATAIGTWLGIWLSQIAYHGADLAVAQTLMSTCPLFAIPVVWICFGHKSTRYAIVGTILTLVGIWMTVQKADVLEHSHLSLRGCDFMETCSSNSSRFGASHG